MAKKFSLMVAEQGFGYAGHMPTKDDPLGLFDPITDFESEEEAAAYDKWFREQVEASLASTKPTIPHEEVKRQLREMLDQKFREQAARDGER